MQRREFLLGSLALKKSKMAQATLLVKRAVASGDVRAAGLLVQQDRATTASMSPDEVFILASISKPMTATGVMILADRRALALSDPVRKFIPEFSGANRDRVTIFNLLTHTSGLPDMLPENTDLRKRHAPLRDFVAGVCKTPLLFPPGTEVRYQSMGILLAAEICERLTRMPFRDYLRNELFRPLGMTRTSLGLGGRKISDTALCQVSEDTDWNSNSPYWRDLGAPWGGVHSTARDVTRLLDFFLRPTGRILKRETAASMIVNQTKGLNKPWGLGWMVEPGAFGKACSPRTFGHYGASGTVAWADPESNVTCVLLTTKPAAQSRDGLLGPVSDLVSESV